MMGEIYLANEEKEFTKDLIDKSRFPVQSKLIGIHPSIPTGVQWDINDYVTLVDRIHNEKIGNVVLLSGPDEIKNTKLF